MTNRTMLYKYPGNEREDAVLQDGVYRVIVVESEKVAEKRQAEGWYMTKEDARAAYYASIGGTTPPPTTPGTPVVYVPSSANSGLKTASGADIPVNCVWQGA